MLWNGQKYAEAKAQFEAAVKAKPDYPEALYRLGMASLNVGDMAGAKTAFQNYMKVAPTGDKAGEVKGILDSLPK